MEMLRLRLLRKLRSARTALGRAHVDGQMTEPRKPVTQVIGGAGISDASRFGEAPEAIHVDENKLIAERREKLKALRAQGNAFPNDFRPDAFAGDLQGEFDGKDAAAVEAAQRRVDVAGRLLAKRIMKFNFTRIINGRAWK